MDYQDLIAPAGTADNMGGTTQRVYFAPLSTFLSIKKPTASPSTLADLVDITTAHTFNTGGCFLKAYCTADKGKVDVKPQGERDGKSFMQEAEFFYPGNESQAHAMAAQFKNDKFIFLFEKPDSATKGYLQVGTEMFPAEISPEFTTGTNASGVQGYIFKVSAMTDKQYIYKSTISLTPAT